jgi:hypothetical protein
MLSDMVRTWLDSYDIGNISGLELSEMLDSHLRLHPEKGSEILAVLLEHSDPHLRFVGKLIAQRTNDYPVQCKFDPMPPLNQADNEPELLPHP